MRICFLTHYFPPERGAPQVRLHALASHLAAAGHDVVVHTGFPNYPAGRILTPYRNRLVAREDDAAGFRVVRSLVLPAPNSGFARRLANHAVFAGFSLATAPASGPADVVVAETPPLFTAAAAVGYARAKGAPLVLNGADRWPASAVAVGALSGPRAVAFAERLEAWCYRRSEALVAPTARLAAALAEHPAARRVEHIPPAVELGRFQVLDPPRNSGPLRVVYAGTVGLAQGVDTLVEAAALAGPDVVDVTIAGDGAAAPGLARLIVERGAANVRMIGVVPPERVGELYASAHAGAVLLEDAPLFEEALPTKLIEVMAAGWPALLAARGEAADLVERVGCGIVVGPRDAAGLAGVMRAMAGSRELARDMGAAGRRHAERHHARSVAVAAWTDLLESVLDGPRRPSPRPARTRDPLISGQ
jgi:colanic acid biosynthesis glycosyl transferase WcaI